MQLSRCWCASERDARLKKAASEAEEEIAAYRAAKEAEYQAEVDKVRSLFL